MRKKEQQKEERKYKKRKHEHVIGQLEEGAKILRGNLKMYSGHRSILALASCRSWGVRLKELEEAIRVLKKDQKK